MDSGHPRTGLLVYLLEGTLPPVMPNVAHHRKGGLCIIFAARGRFHNEEPGKAIGVEPLEGMRDCK